MYCPQCEANGQKPNGYCTRCGAWLVDPATAPGSSMQRLPPDARLKSIMQFNLICAVLSLFSAIALIATHLDEEKASWSVFVAALCCFFICANQIISFFVCRGLRKRLKPEETTRAIGNERSAPELNPAREGEFIGAPSVTENTTELFEPARVAREVRERR